MPRYSRRTIEELLECRAPRWVERVDADGKLELKLYDGDELLGALRANVGQGRDAAEARIRSAFSLHALICAAGVSKVKNLEGVPAWIARTDLVCDSRVVDHRERLLKRAL